jgi:hypothetical protein
MILANSLSKSARVSGGTVSRVSGDSWNSENTACKVDAHKTRDAVVHEEVLLRGDFDLPDPNAHRRGRVLMDVAAR